MRVAYRIKPTQQNVGKRNFTVNVTLRTSWCTQTC